MRTNFCNLNFQRGGKYVKTTAKHIFFYAALDSSEQTGRLIDAGNVNLEQELHSE